MLSNNSCLFLYKFCRTYTVYPNFCFFLMDGEPCRPGVAITDLMAGLFIVDAVVAALYERNDTGVGKNISTSLLQTQVSSSNFFIVCTYLKCLSSLNKCTTFIKTK